VFRSAPSAWKLGRSLDRAAIGFGEVSFILQSHPAVPPTRSFGAHFLRLGQSTSSAKKPVNMNGTGDRLESLTDDFQYLDFELYSNCFVQIQGVAASIPQFPSGIRRIVRYSSGRPAV
jgi:hypothetical protein